MSNSCVRRARGSCWVVNGCWRIEGRSGWFLVPTPLLSSIKPTCPTPASHLKQLLCCWPLLGVLGQSQLEEVVEILGPSGHKSPPPIPRPRLALMQDILPPASCCHSRGLCWACQQGTSPRPRATGLSNTAVATRRLLHHQPSALLPRPHSPRPLPQMVCRGSEIKAEGSSVPMWTG